MGFCIITYDIPDDRLRYAVANKLKDYGLERLQLSVFQGYLTRNRAEELAIVLRELVGDEEADIRIFFICEKCRGRAIVVKERYIVEEEVVVT